MWRLIALVDDAVKMGKIAVRKTLIGSLFAITEKAETQARETKRQGNPGQRCLLGLFTERTSGDDIIYLLPIISRKLCPRPLPLRTGRYLASGQHSSQGERCGRSGRANSSFEMSKER